MFCWKFFDADGEHLGNSDSHPTIDAAVSWLQKQAEEDLPDVDVDADTAQLSVVKHVKIQRKVQLIGLPELVAAGAVSAPTPATTEAPAATPRRGRKLAVVPAPADIAEQVQQSPAEPAVTELASVMDAGPEPELAELTPRSRAEAEAVIADIQAQLDAAPAVTSKAIVEAIKDRLLRTGVPATEAQLVGYLKSKLVGADGLDLSSIVDALTEDGTMLAAGITWCVVDGAVTYSLVKPDAAPEPVSAPQSPWEIVVDDCTVELRVGSQWSHQVYGSAATAGTVAGRLRSHMESGASGPASVAQRFVAGRAPAAAAVPEL